LLPAAARDSEEFQHAHFAPQGLAPARRVDQSRSSRHRRRHFCFWANTSCVVGRAGRIERTRPRVGRGASAFAAGETTFRPSVGGG